VYIVQVRILRGFVCPAYQWTELATFVERSMVSSSITPTTSCSLNSDALTGAKAVLLPCICTVSLNCR
jgi:hypothetical protein